MHFPYKYHVNQVNLKLLISEFQTQKIVSLRHKNEYS